MNDMTRRRFLAGAACSAGMAAPSATKGTPPGVELVREEPRPSREEIAKRWTTVLTHTHRWRWPDDRATVPFDEAQRRLAEWCAANGIRAAGVGSAWDPISLATYLRYEGPDRDLYYSGRLDPHSVMDTGAVEAMIEQLNRFARGRTLFYLDNETPKGATCHMWWFGYRYDYPAWHDYSQDRPIRLFLDDKDVEINPITGQPHTRRTPFEIAAAQHEGGALGVFAHPTRWWISDGKFITNIAAFAPLFLAAYGRLDGLTVMGDTAFHRNYQALWYNLLDTGAVVPGFAETDFALNAGPRAAGPDLWLNYMPVGPNPSEASIVASARAGQAFASNGPLVLMEIDRHPMGSAIETAAGRHHRIHLTVCPAPGEQAIGRLELISNGGEVIASKERVREGHITYRVAGSNTPRFIVARVFGEHDAPEKSVKYHALTNPVYLHPAGFRVGAASTACRIRIGPGSPWTGGTLEFQDPRGNTILSRAIRGGEIEETVPADSQMVVHKNEARELRFFIALENKVIEKRLRYLMFGEFRRDRPDLKGSQVPVDAFGLAEMRAAIKAFSYTL